MVVVVVVIRDEPRVLDEFETVVVDVEVLIGSESEVGRTAGPASVNVVYIVVVAVETPPTVSVLVGVVVVR